MSGRNVQVKARNTRGRLGAPHSEGTTQSGNIAATTRCTKGDATGRHAADVGEDLSCVTSGRHRSDKPALQPYWGKPAVGMIGRVEETSDHSKPDPRLDPTRLRGRGAILVPCTLRTA